MAPGLAPVLSAVTLVLSLAFAAQCLLAWRRGRKRHQLLWGVSLVLFALASGLELLGFLAGWGEASYKLYFILTAAMVGFMGAGTADLTSKHLGSAGLAFILVVGWAMAFFVTFAPIDAARLAQASAGGELPTKILTTASFLHPLIDIPAALLLLAGALLSYKATRAPHALLIALGAIAFTGIHTLASGAQTGALAVTSAEVFTAGSLVGVVLLYAGYIKARDAPRRADAQAVAAGA